MCKERGTFQKDQIQAKRKILVRLCSNLVWDDEKLSISFVKPLEALFAGIKDAKSINSKFEPKKCVVNEGLNEKTEVFSSVFSTMLAWRDSFRTFDWAGIYSDFDFHLKSINRLVSLA